MSVTSPSRLLRAKIALGSSGLNTVASALWSHAAFASLYPNYLFFNHAVVRTSVPLMRAALAEAVKQPSTDAVAVGLAEYLTQHIPEETGHDDWLLQDLEALGVSRAECLRRLPSPNVASLVGAQYYWICHFHPVAVLGYIAVLEGSPPSRAHVETVARRSGVPMSAFSTLIRHADIDPHHRDALDHALDALPLADWHTELLGVSAFHTIHWLNRVIEEAMTTAVNFPRATGMQGGSPRARIHPPVSAPDQSNGIPT